MCFVYFNDDNFFFENKQYSSNTQDGAMGIKKNFVLVIFFIFIINYVELHGDTLDIVVLCLLIICILTIVEKYIMSHKY